MNNLNYKTYQQGIDESKIDRLTFHLSLWSFQGARTYDAGLKLRCVCDMIEKRDVNRRVELWIIEAFHLANLPTITLGSRLQNYKIVAPRIWLRYHSLYATLFLLPTYCLSCICSPSEECRTQIIGIRQFRQGYREGLLVSALQSGHFS